MTAKTSRSSILIGCALAFLGCGAAAQTEVHHFSGMWTRGPAVHADFKAPESGPGPVLNLTPAPPNQPAGQGSHHQGDFSNPILQPWAADIVKEIGDADIAGQPVRFPGNLCQPYGLPFILRLGDAVQFLQSEGLLVILYAEEMRARIVHMNGAHPAEISPSYYGDSIGHWEGDVLVIDTIGLIDTTWTDRFGTPHTEELHVVERYRQLDDGTLRVDLMVEDKGAFTMPWRAYVIYTPWDSYFVEQVCPQNAIDLFTGRELPIPSDPTPDF